MSTEYEWASGAHIVVDPNVAGTALEAMVETHQALTPRIVVDESQPVDAPLHPAFEWNDAKAADEYRLHQARHVVRSITIIKTAEDGKPEPLRAYVNVTVKDASNKPQRIYIGTQAAMVDKELREQVLETALHELKAFRRKYAQLQELASVFDVIDAISDPQAGNTTN